MKASRWILSIVSIMALALLLNGCSPEPAAVTEPVSVTTEPVPITDDNIDVRVVVTRDFGRQVLLDATIEVAPGCSSLAALEQVTDVTTAYGGGFVDSINGLRSQYSGGQAEQYDWLVYFNGIQSKTGALDYTMRQDDVQRWDFRHWSFRISIPAIVGDFPEPFLHGYAGRVKPTIIVYDGGFEQDAEAVEDALVGLGVADVSSQPISELGDDDKRNANLIIIGYSDDEMLTEMNGVWNRLGFFARFEDGMLDIYTGTGERAARYGPGTGIIQATQSPWNPRSTAACENVVWMVSGTDAAGIEAAAQALATRSSELQHAFAVVVTGGEIIRVP